LLENKAPRNASGCIKKTLKIRNLQIECSSEKEYPFSLQVFGEFKLKKLRFVNQISKVLLNRKIRKGKDKQFFISRQKRREK
jgi:hypothetical protein